MLIVMHQEATSEQIDRVSRTIASMGLKGRPIPGAQRVAIGITGNKAQVDETKLNALPGVLEIIHVTKPYKLASREMKPDDSVFKVGNIEIGGPDLTIIAGPCAVESRERTLRTAHAAKAAGAVMMRGGAFKPRTSPYSFQGLGEEGLEILAQARDETGLYVVSEVTDIRMFDLVEHYVDVIQIGARNMQNYPLLTRAGQSKKPILLKRGMSATTQELLLAAEYIITEGNPQVVLCERGIRTFSTHSRYTLDVSAIPELKQQSHLPVIVDPSHAAGKRFMVAPLARAGIAAGADGIIVEIHPEPEKALCDGPQALTLELFSNLMREIEAIGIGIGRSLCSERRAQVPA